MNWHQILTIQITDKYSLSVEVGVTLLILFALVSICAIVFRVFIKRDNFFSTEIELNVNLGGIGNVKIKQNTEVAQIAHKAWTEFITRKAGLEFDPEHDVIAEVYNSWKELFERIRFLIKDIPASRIKRENTQKLVNLLVDSLNKGLRPHLTKWQARFRRWYESEIVKDENKNKTPQDIQKTYPHYDELIRDLMLINQQIISYTNELKKLTQ